MKRYLLALDLKPDEGLIREYDAYHQAVWPEVLESLRESGISQMEIFRTGNRLTMLLETHDSFSFEEKARLDAANSKVQEWETLMDRYQDRLPWVAPGAKWTLMHSVFVLNP
jgi:L-rhamnose mutarotase